MRAAPARRNAEALEGLRPRSRRHAEEQGHVGLRWSRTALRNFIPLTRLSRKFSAMRFSGSSPPSRLQYPEHARPTNRELFSDLLGLHTLPPQLYHLGSLPLRRGDPPSILALGLGLGHSLPLALQHDLPLKLCKGSRTV